MGAETKLSLSRPQEIRALRRITGEYSLFCPPLADLVLAGAMGLTIPVLIPSVDTIFARVTDLTGELVVFVHSTPHLRLCVVYPKLDNLPN